MAASARDRRAGKGATSEHESNRTADVAAQARLIDALRATLRTDTGARAELIETHISYVLLTGHTAYKIKKAVNLGFLDFRTLAARRLYCNEEIRLNRRLAPQIYVDVVAIGGTLDAPALATNPIGEAADAPAAAGAIEYAVRMNEFPQSALAMHALSRGELTPAHISTLAAVVAEFHRTAAEAPAAGRLGAPAVIVDIALQNFVHLQPLVDGADDIADLDALAAWTRAQYVACFPAMLARRAGGFIRECHGDLHLGNIALLDGAPVVFDCIEFNDEMRWIDVMSEIAFTAMDLADRGRADLAHRFLDAYLEITGDYAGLPVLRFYLVYRAMVRAKIARIRYAQCEPGAAADRLRAEYGTYVRLAQAYARPPRPALVLMQGLSGSGKTVVAQALLEAGGAVRVRTDVERKRLAGRATGEHAGDAFEGGLYSPDATRVTYERVLALAADITRAGSVALIDGAFLKASQRRLFHAWAQRRRLPFVVVACHARDAVLRERVARRAAAGRDASDADLAVLAGQLAVAEPLSADERRYVVDVDTETPLDAAFGATLWRAVAGRIAAAVEIPMQQTPAPPPRTPATGIR